MAFFLHIPFPSLDIFLKLPWRFGVLRSLLEYDLIGFQTVRDRRNFLECVRLLLPDAEIAGRGDVRRVGLGGREIRVGTFPISIDVGAFERRAAEKEVVAKARELRADEPDRKILLGIDRLDYTKGIPQKLEAFRSLLTRFPRLRERATLFQVVVPSREDIPRYRDHKRMIERLVGQINGQFTRSGWVPIHYLYRALDGPRLPAYYLAADVAVVTPLKDGMNLVAKEYCATHSDERGTLVLSEFAGAAAQLQRGALLVNPYDTEGMAGILERALSLSPEEQRSRMHRLRRSVKEYDIYRWVDHFLDAAISRDLSDFPRLEEYIPEATAS
jgi:trehalose 6-phosphate synthase